MDPRGNGLYYQWSPSVGLSKTNIANPIASPPVNTRYFVTSWTEAGCIAKDSIDVIVRDETNLGLPNAFTPGSAPNDLLRLNKNGIAVLKLFKVFNRWGAVIFETTNIDEGWDGTFNGKPQPMGVYVYMIDATTSTGKRFTKQGNVTLIR
jgi:gliding motility-associated-like protein